MGSTGTAQCLASRVSLLCSVLLGDPGPGGPQGSDVRRRGRPATLSAWTFVRQHGEFGY